jgi:hypothetical protein
MVISFQKDIRPLFRPKDIACMDAMGVLLGDYDYMSDPAGNDIYRDHANARTVLCHLSPNQCTPRMPMGGPYWSEQQLATFDQWMTDGFQP